METKPLNVNSALFSKHVVETVIPAIREKWPGGRSGKIFKQQGKARPHSRAADKAINAEGKRYG